MTFYIHCDGSCYNHPEHNTTGSAAVMSKKQDPHMTELIEIKTGWQSEGTNNTAEWQAILYAMEMMIEHHKNHSTSIYYIYSDSQLAVGQANGVWNVRNKELQYYYAEYKALEKKALYARILFYIEWIPRQQNKTADMYSKLVNPYFKDKIKNEICTPEGSGVEDIREFQGSHDHKRKPKRRSGPGFRFA